MTKADEQKESVPIRLSAGALSQPGEAIILTNSKAQALRRALAGWGGCWGLALAAVPIPLVHFLVVPLGLILGPIVGLALFKIYNGARDITEGGGPCPQCGSTLSLPQAAERWPQPLRCAQCQTNVLAHLAITSHEPPVWSHAPTTNEVSQN